MAPLSNVSLSCPLPYKSSLKKKLLSFSFSTQTHILELIKELGLETYPQYTIGKKVHHMGGPDAKIRTYSSSIPALSPLVLMDLTQLLWKVRQQICAELFDTGLCSDRTKKNEQNKTHSQWTHGSYRPKELFHYFLLIFTCVIGIK